MHPQYLAACIGRAYIRGFLHWNNTPSHSDVPQNVKGGGPKAT